MYFGTKFNGDDHKSLERSQTKKSGLKISPLKLMLRITGGSNQGRRRRRNECLSGEECALCALLIILVARLSLIWRWYPIRPPRALFRRVASTGPNEMLGSPLNWNVENFFLSNNNKNNRAPSSNENLEPPKQISRPNKSRDRLGHPFNDRFHIQIRQSHRPCTSSSSWSGRLWDRPSSSTAKSNPARQLFTFGAEVTEWSSMKRPSTWCSPPPAAEWPPRVPQPTQHPGRPSGLKYERARHPGRNKNAPDLSFWPCHFNFLLSFDSSDWPSSTWRPRTTERTAAMRKIRLAKRMESSPSTVSDFHYRRLLQFFFVAKKMDAPRPIKLRRRPDGARRFSIASRRSTRAPSV